MRVEILLDKSDLFAERDRRLEKGFTHTFPDDRGKHFFATTKGDMIGWEKVSIAASAAVSLGYGDFFYIPITTGTGSVVVTAKEWMSIILDGFTAHEQPIWQSSFVLEDMEKLPEDFASKKDYWTKTGFEE